jgi:hypothetical protein
MALPKLQLPPAQAGYGVAQGATFRQAQLGGGRSRFRLDDANAPAIASVQWVLGPVQWQYLQAFVRTTLVRGSLHFMCDLIFDDALVQEYEVHLLPGSFGLSGVQGMRYTAKAQVEVVLQPVNAVADAGIVFAYNNYGERGPMVFDLLAKLVNDDLARTG